VSRKKIREGGEKIEICGEKWDRLKKKIEEAKE
jgi:hypothetical protein